MNITIDWAYWARPDTITAYSTLLLMLVTGALVLTTWKYVKEVRGQAKDLQDQAGAMKRQADAMDGQSNLIRMQADAMTRQADTIERQSEFVQEESRTMRDQAKVMFDQAEAMKEQAEIMKKQSSLMLENMEYDRLIKRHERVNKEISLFIGPLYARRKDHSIFSLKKSSQRVRIYRQTIVDQENYDYVSFWDSIEQNEYLNRSSRFKKALEHYKSKIAEHFELSEKTEIPEEKTKRQDCFYKIDRPKLIEEIEIRYNELNDELAGIENELKISRKKT
jgi:hypothetical protein